MTTSVVDTAAAAAAAQHAALGIKALQINAHTTHPEAQWFPQAGLGLFIHWGISAVHGGIDLSWGMIANTPWDAAAQGKNKIIPEDYWALAPRFQPDCYDPDPWLKAAAGAGFQYAVLTAQHHDGYTLWPSRYSSLGVQSYLGGRDLVRPYVEACRRYGLKVGLYCSPPDWFFDRNYKSFNYGTEDPARFPGRPHFNTRHLPCTLAPKPADHDARRRELVHHRVEELLTNYGRIDLLWLDGGEHDNAIRDRARQLQPHIVLNSRSCDGDFGCTECRQPTEKFSGWFETCHCWQKSGWGYTQDEDYHSTAWLLALLAHLRTWGGNVLINVGPRPNGELPAVAYQRFSELAAWMQLRRSAIIGSTPGPYPEQSNVPVTVNQGLWYLFLLPQPTAPVVVRGVQRPKSITLLGTAARVPHTWHDGQLEITVPQSMRCHEVDVLAVAW